MSAVSPPRPRAQRVTFVLDVSARTRNRFGGDFYARVLYLHLKGCSVRQIARQLGCDKDTVNAPLLAWRTQVEMLLKGEPPPASCNVGLQSKTGPSPKIN